MLRKLAPLFLISCTGSGVPPAGALLDELVVCPTNGKALGYCVLESDRISTMQWTAAPRDVTSPPPDSHDRPNCYSYAQDSGGQWVRDLSVGFAAFDSPHIQFREGQTNLDIGGGRFDNNSRYVNTCYGVNNAVYDPDARDARHNEAVLRDSSNAAQNARLYDSVTIFSVLNVIETADARREVISLARRHLKPNGKAYFRIYEGNGSGVHTAAGENGKRYSQTNLKTSAYLSEIAAVFDAELVESEHLIVATPR